MLDKIKELYGNKWVRFSMATLLYFMWFGVWTGAWWSMVGIAVIYDLYISGHITRVVGSRLTELSSRSSVFRGVYEWVNALIFASVVATLIHTYIFQLYVIPTSSMEKSLLVGDYLYVSKASYGPKMPNTPLSFPFVHHTMPLTTEVKSFSDLIQLPYKRLAGVKPIKREDVVVFNFPAGDTVLVENQGVTYYDVLRSYELSYGKEEGRRRLFDDYTVIARPVDKRENYIKRLVAMPGDTLHIVNSQMTINGKAENKAKNAQFIYVVHTTSPLTETQLRSLNITEASGNGYIYQMPLSEEGAEVVRGWSNVNNAEQYIAHGGTTDVFPHDDRYMWNADNYGPLWIPAKGATVELTLDNLPLYERVISLYEGNELRVEGEQIYINGSPASSYTFQMDYFWMMGDNRHNSADSRYWGFVPEDHIVGKASFVWLSLDAQESFPKNIRWDRIFTKIK